VRLVVALLAVVALGGCGGHKTPSAEDVARAWSAALDRNDNAAAGALFAPNATVVQNGSLRLADHDQAASWNALLPCGGKITSIDRRSPSDVVAVFDLKERPGHVCDAPGRQAAALFRVRGGKIVLWQQVPVPSAGQGQSV